MKGLKKIALATAVAAAPFAAQAELKALNDSAMGNVTGQAGVTIELETKVSIGQFKYTDTNEGGTNEVGGGSFAVNDIVLGGAGVTADGASKGYNSILDQLKIDIDVANDGDAVIHVGSLQTVDHDTDPATPEIPAPIDWGMTAESMELQSSDYDGGTTGNNTVLLSNLTMHGNLAALDLRVDTATDHLNAAVAFDIRDMDFDVAFLGIGIRNMVISGAGDNFDYDGDGTVGGSDTSIDFGNDGTVEIDKTSAVGQLAYGKLSKYANVNLDVYKGAGLGDNSTATNALRVDVNNVYMDVAIGDIQIGGDITSATGGQSIGSVALDNLAITDTKLAIYGH